MTPCKHLVFPIAAALIFSMGYAQVPTAMPLTDLKTASSPCFQLLDIAPSSIQHPGNPKEFATSALSQIGTGTSLPKNFAFDVAPYWYFRPQNENVYKYLNIDPNHSSAYYFTGIPRKLTISVSSSFSDSTAGSLLKNTNYISLGFQTNILTIRTGRNIDSTVRYLKALRSELKKCTAIADNATDLAKCMGDSAVVDSTNLQRQLNVVPLFQLDAAFAYAEAFASNTFSQSRFNRTAGWLTATLGIPLSKKTGDNISILVLGKLIQDNILNDTAHNVFQRKSAIDIGGKVCYENGNFLIGAELVQRSYANDAVLNSHRVVGLLQYKVNSTIYLAASFGQNFGNVHNLFSAIGLHFGFGSKSSALPD